MAYGLLGTGFAAKPLSVIKAELDAAFKAAFGASMGSEPDGSIPAQTPEGQIIGIVADAASGLWDLAQAVDAAFDPDQAAAAALDKVCAITGTTRDEATKSTVTLTATGTAVTVLPIGRVVRVTGTGSRFVTLGAATITALTAWATSTAYAVGARRTANGRVYQCIASGTSAGVGTGPSSTSTSITDNTVTWAYVGEGTAAIDVAAEAETAGQVAALARTLTDIATPVAGWSSVTNLLDAEVGTEAETDPELRVKREAELGAAGNGTVDAIRANVLRVTGVTSCRVFENTSMVTDGSGLPAKSIEVLVLGGDDAEVGQAIWDAKPAGIQTYGSTTTAAIDGEGVSQAVKFSRPTNVNIYVRVDVTRYDSTFPSDGDAQIKQLIADFGNALGVGRSVRSQPLGGILVPDEDGVGGVTGVLEATLVYIGTTNPAVASTTIAITSRQLSRFDTSRITVNLASGTP